MKKITTIILCTAIILFVAGFAFSKTSADNDKVLTMQEALTTDFHTPNFEFDETKLTVRTISPNFEKGTDLTISKEQKEQLINEIQQLELLEHDYVNLYETVQKDSMYIISLTISTFYKFYFDADAETVYIIDKTGYKIKNGDKLFAILNEIKNTPTKNW